MLTAQDVADCRFSASRFAPGYDQDAVDEFLERVYRVLRARETGVPADRPLTAADVRDVTFPVTKFREGYVMEDVDALLDRVREALGDGTSTLPSSPPPPPPAATPPDPAATPGPSAPRRGWLDRLLGR